MEKTKSIRSFTDLDTWREGHKLVVQMYELVKTFPKEETFGLTSQMRRAAVSITSNIAEGFSRQSINDKAHFYTMAHSSLTEIQNQLLIARDVSYLSDEEFSKIAPQAVTVHKLINGLIKSTKARENIP